jgi:hypothetical protein
MRGPLGGHQEDSLYFWNIEGLKTELRGRPVPPADVLRYAAAILVIWTGSSLIPVESEVLDLADAAILGLIIVVTVLGLWIAYRANGGAHGTDLAGRYLALGWVIGLRLTALWLAIFVALALTVFVLAFWERELSDRALDVLAWAAVLVTEVVFYWRLAHHLATVRSAA